ncbi:hypothetical protein MUK42_03055, partial [Musa troglodytarum]
KLTLRSAPAQKTFGTELDTTTTLADESLPIVSIAFCSPLSISFPIAFFASGLSNFSSIIPGQHRR